VSHETIYRALFVQGRGGLRKEAPDDESLQRIGTASNTAFWAALALAGAHFVRRIPDP